MIKKIAICMMAVFFIIGIASFTAAKETINGIGVKGVQDPIDKMARAFVKKNPTIEVKTKEEKGGVAIETIGKGAAGYTFGMITRPLDAKEKAAYPDVKEFLFAKDGVTVVVHPSNPIKGLTSAQIKDIFAGKITNWAQVGGKKGPIAVQIREKGAGQRTAFEDAIMGTEKIPAGKGKESGSMGAMKTEVGIDDAAIGYILISAVDKSVKAIEVDGIAPTLENVKKGSHKATIPLYLITKGEPKGATKTFIDYLMSTEGQAAVEKEKLAPAAKK